MSSRRGIGICPRGGSGRAFVEPAEGASQRKVRPALLLEGGACHEEIRGQSLERSERAVAPLRRRCLAEAGRGERAFGPVEEPEVREHDDRE
jgi:hypothetical protein